MMTSTFERAVQPREIEPEPHTPGPFMRHGVMVRDTAETVGGMFCIRPGRMVVNHAERTVPQYGDTIAYVYSRADANLFAAAPDMLAALRASEATLASTLALRGYRQGECTDDWHQMVKDEVRALSVVRAAIAKAEGRE